MYCECKLASDAGRTPADGGDGHDWSAAEAYQHVRKLCQARRAWRQISCIFQPCKKVIVSQKETFDRAVEHNNLYIMVAFKCCDDLIQLRDGLRTKNVQGRVVKRNSPVGW